MSGYVPDFIKKGGYVKVGHVKIKVKDYYFTSSDTPYVPNTDKLVLVLENGTSIAAYRVKPARKEKNKKPKRRRS